ncbi:alpha-N-arabinofuranosidase [Bifidobacterium callimiconis]|uniref:non-reducing end alpha-L-arabinofuranosidase n=1 Tax=Bifidobacterium callimiconis TaxID=2306973 RepID=A0A430FB23_9BIFI|nr:alpha-N-arabinofuranosidase [Bifidobacterium callimiconis]RSX50044.1 alpha-L-arabinofuranosidase [Bifidobacterium callimiconis]
MTQQSASSATPTNSTHSADPTTSPNPAVSASITINPYFTVAPVSRRIFGSFVEHLGRCVYTGIYEPDHPTADEHGFRQDVIDLVRELGVTTVRYPGGNFVSGYRWEDGVGPRDQRPRRLDLAWHSTETNAFGLHEMAEWLEKVGEKDGEPGAAETTSEPESAESSSATVPATPELMEAINLGTRGLQDALDLLEYANIPGGTTLSDARRANGHEKPFNIRMWCLGNEMDGPWQLGHKSAHDYGVLAADVARGMRQIDPDLGLVVCGSSSHGMPTFGEWERTVLEHTYDLVDFVSCHAYYKPANGDIASFLASGVDMDGFIKDVGSVIDAVKAQRKSTHNVAISFDEWNVWYAGEEASRTPEGIGNWPVAPRLLEDQYSALDAVVVGDLLITLLRNADRVHAASLAQLVNVIAPIMTEPGGPAWRQTIFYPFAAVASLAKGGTVLESRTDGPTVTTAAYGDVPVIDSVTVRCADGSLAMFVTNRSLDSSVDLTIPIPESWLHEDKAGTVAGVSVDARTLHDDDINARNTIDDQNHVTLQPNPTACVETDDAHASVHVTLPPVSWTALHLTR